MNYLFLSSATLALMFIGFKLTMSHTTFHRFNRIVLLMILVLSAILPLAQFDRIGRKVTNLISEIELSREVTNYTAEIEKPVEANVAYPLTNTSEPTEIDYADSFVPTQSETIQSEKQTATTLSPIEILRLVYVIGLILFLSNLIISIIRTEIICHKRGRYLSDGTKLVLLPNEFSPFSWRRCIVMSETDYQRDGKTIETHELAHVHNHHTLDLILAQICCSAQWFNPAAWALLHSLKEQHEFEADSTVLQHGIEAKEYQICLIRATLVHKLVLATNNFADCSTKKRINMMNKKSTLPLARFRVLIMLPIILIIIAVASGCKSKNNSQLSENGQEEPVFETVEEPEIVDTLAYIFNHIDSDPDTFIVVKEYDVINNRDKYFDIKAQEGDEIFVNGENINITDLRSKIHEWLPNGTDSIMAVIRWEGASKKVIVDILKILRSEFKNENISTVQKMLPPPLLNLGITDTLKYLFNHSIQNFKAEKYLTDGRHKLFDVSINSNNEISVNDQVIEITELKPKIQELFPNGTATGLSLLSFDLNASKTFVLDVYNILDGEFVSCFTNEPTVLNIVDVVDVKQE